MEEIMDNAPDTLKASFWVFRVLGMGAVACAFYMGMTGAFVGALVCGVMAVLLGVSEARTFEKIALDYFFCCLEQELTRADRDFEEAETEIEV